MTMTVGDLRKALENVSDELEVIVYSCEVCDPPETDVDTVCALTEAIQQEDEEGNVYFALYADNDDNDSEDDETEDEETDSTE